MVRIRLPSSGESANHRFLYVDTTIRRWQRFTGDSATHAGDGRRFDDLARESEARDG